MLRFQCSFLAANYQYPGDVPSSKWQTFQPPALPCFETEVKRLSQKPPTKSLLKSLGESWQGWRFKVSRSVMVWYTSGRQGNGPGFFRCTFYWTWDMIIATSGRFYVEKSYHICWWLLSYSAVVHASFLLLCAVLCCFCAFICILCAFVISVCAQSILMQQWLSAAWMWLKPGACMLVYQRVISLLLISMG